jgi:hypothetical protein
MDLVDQMVSAQWRLRRIWRMQTAALDLKMDQQEAEIAKRFNQIDQTTRATVAFTALANDEKALDLLLRYEIAYTRMHQRAMNSLSKHRIEKLRNDPEPPSEPQEKSQNDQGSQSDSSEPPVFDTTTTPKTRSFNPPTEQSELRPSGSDTAINPTQQIEQKPEINPNP